MSNWKEVEDEVDAELSGGKTDAVVTEPKPDDEKPAEGEPAKVEVEEPAKEVAKAEDEPAKKGEEAEKTEPLRDEKGRFIPLDRHESILQRQRDELAAKEAELAQLREKVSKIPAEPTEDDKAFETRIAAFPDEVQDVLREQRNQIKELRTAREREEEDRKATEAKKAKDDEHAAALAASNLTETWKDDGLRSLLTTISDKMFDDPNYKPASRAEHYKDVEAKFHEKYPQLRPQTAAPKAEPKTETKAETPKAPSSMSSIRGAVPEARSSTDAFIEKSPLALVAETANMSKDEFERYMASV